MKHLIFAVLSLLGSVAFADHDNVSALARGSYLATSVVTGSSTTGTNFAAPNTKREDGIYFNNTASTVWIGTTTATIQANHSNITIGFPVNSSSTFKLDGLMTGAAAFTCDSGVSTCEVRTLEGLVQ